MSLPFCLVSIRHSSINPALVSSETGPLQEKVYMKAILPLLSSTIVPGRLGYDSPYSITLYTPAGAVSLPNHWYIFPSDSLLSCTSDS